MSLRVKRNHHSSPKTYKYVCDGAEFTSEDVDELAEKVSQYRRNNSLPEGDPENDIAAQLVKSCPWMVYDDNESNESDGPVIGAVVDSCWLFKARQREERDVCETRMETCRGCPHAASMEDCGEELDGQSSHRLAVMLGDFLKPKDIFICSHHGTLCNLEAVYRTPSCEPEPGAPDFCWFKKGS